MPEIKNTFMQGKMNKDLDERLVPNGQYRDALNVEVSTADGSDVGVVKNILGNHRVETLVGGDFKCVGSVADEKTNKFYWFVSTYAVDAIIEYDVINDAASAILVDTNAGNFNAVLKFSGNIITGINIIDNLLFWTDNNSDPKKINIDTCREGTIQDGTLNNHTQLIFENGSFNGAVIDIVSPWSGSHVNHIGDYEEGAHSKGRYAWFEYKHLKAVLGGYVNGDVRYIKHYRNGKFLGEREIEAYGDGTPEIPARIRINGLAAPYTEEQKIWHVGDNIFGVDVNLDIEERHVTVIKPKPINALSVKINHADSSYSTGNIPNLFETKIPRFSYRYKFRDGEYSAFAPFTSPVFNAKYPRDNSVSNDTDIFYNKDNAYDIKEPYNKAMVNSIHSVELSDFIDAQTPEDVIEIDILYKQEESSIIYSIDTIKHFDKNWHKKSNHQGIGLDLGLGMAEGIFLPSEGAWHAVGSLTKGRYLVTTENIYAALPANQLLRPWDNVPRKALAQEVTGSRIVYGNYVQNYDIVNEAQVSVSYSDRQDGSYQGGTMDLATKGLPSIKSQRNYQLGVIYCDKFGRETPVFTSKTAAVNVPWQNSSGKKNASKSNQLNASVAANFPEWVDSLKFFIKETSNPYYNLAMDRAWVTQRTAELDNSEGHVWLSFPSSDRNKISEEDYIILKKKIGTGEEQVNLENKYKVLDIKNEAPDAIKYELVFLGSYAQFGVDALTVDNTADKLFGASKRIDHQVSLLVIDKIAWMGGHGYRPKLNDGDYSGLSDGGNANSGDIIKKNLYVSWRRLNASDNSGSKKYKVTGGWIGSNGYVLQLDRHITKVDADIASLTGNSEVTATNMHPDLRFMVHEKVLKDDRDFSGKFFVKISKNQVSETITHGNPVSILDRFQVQSKAHTHYFQDIIANSQFDVGDSNYGNTNYNGVPVSYDPAGENIISGEISNGPNNTIGNVGASGTSGGTLYVSDYAEAWSGIQDKLNEHQSRDHTFFIDSMHMAAGQSEASDYAKYCCITWSSGTVGEDISAEDSAWSYPPLKTWISDFGDTSNMITPESESGSVENDSYAIIPANSIWHENNLISTSPVLSQNEDFEYLRIDGWVGPLQNVERIVPDYVANYNAASQNNINGLEGVVTTSLAHSIGPRRWFSGITGNDHGAGTDTKTYSNNGEIGKHFMHLSFFAPGKDLHSGTFHTLAAPALYGSTSFAANLQGIWGGGVFTGRNPDERFGITDDHIHLAMEGNTDAGGNVLAETPGPGVGYGYDLDYRELHERQWDPTFTVDGDDHHEIRDFIRNLHPGSRFRFHKTVNPPGGGSGNIGEEVYTIKKVQIKKLYNHTSWRKPLNRFDYNNAGEEYGQDVTLSQDFLEYISVEEAGLRFLDQCDVNGFGTGVDSNGDGTNDAQDLRDKIVDFGAAHNRRLCYIIELDKDITAATSFDLLSVNVTSADLFNKDYSDIEFLDPVIDHFLVDLNKFPAIWELDPKKAQVDLDIYYEASSNIPIKLNEKTNDLFAPVGCKVQVLNSSVSSTSYLESWDGAVAEFYPGLPKGDGNNEIDYTGMSFKFIRKDGSYTIAEAGQQDLDGDATGVKTIFTFREDIGDVVTLGLDWYNCFSFGNGLESNRIKDDFNEVYIGNGVKASTTTQEAYKEERRKSGLIYSGIYNSNSGVNDLNQFIQAEKITKDLNPTYGSIQKLFQRRISLIAFCEDRVVGITSNKDTIFNADGNPQLIASNKVLGDANPFQGDYGISKNPESFASESYRAYFTDKQRGAVLRLSKDGLTPISNAGMKDWFRDNLPEYNTLLGTYDSYKEEYNVTLANNPNFNENLVLDAYLETGVEVGNNAIGSANKIENAAIHSGSPLQYLWDNGSGFVENNQVANVFTWQDIGGPVVSDDTYRFRGYVNVINHAEIGVGDLQPEVNAVPEILGDLITINPDGVDFAEASFDTSYGGLLDDGWWYDPRFTDNSSIDLWGAARSYNHDAEVNSTIERFIEDFSGTVHSITESNTASETTLSSPPGSGSWAVSYDPSVEKTVAYPISSGNHAGLRKISSAITRNSSTNALTFDRCHNNSYIKFRSIGSEANGVTLPTGAGINQTFVDNGGTVISGNLEHDSFFNGDEIHIQFELTCYVTISAGLNGDDSASWSEVLYGYNYITPQLELWEGDTQKIDSNILANSDSSTYGGPNPYSDMQTSPSDMGNDFEDDHFLMSGTDEYYPGQNADYRYVPYRSFNTSSTVVFPSTTSITALTGTHFNDIGTKTIVCGASFKFKDHNQQLDDGAYNGTVTYDDNGYAENGIENRKVVNDLRIRIKNIEAPYAGANTQWNKDYQGQSFDYPLKRPLWEIKNLKIKKGLGVVAPYTDYLPPTQDIDVGADTNVILQAAVPAVDAVPAVTVPEWAEVEHVSNYGFGSGSWGFGGIIDGNGDPTGNEFWQGNAITSDPSLNQGTALTTNGIGGNTPFIEKTGTHASGATLTWKEPDYANYPFSPIGSPGDSVFGGLSYQHTTAEALAGTYPTPNQFSRDINNANPNYIIVQNTPSGSSTIYHDLGDDHYNTNDWYLVDVEYDETYGDAFNSGSGVNVDDYLLGSGGYLTLSYSASNSGLASNAVGDVIDPNGVGVYTDFDGNAGIGLVVKNRTEYGSPRKVLRAIYQIADDSNYWSNNSYWLSKFLIRAVGLEGGLKIDKIITKKLTDTSNGNEWVDWVGDYSAGTGNGVQVSNWLAKAGDINNQHQPAHAFSKRHIYYSGNKICWEVPNGMNSDIENQDTYSWEQVFAIPPAVSPLLWELSFTVSNNPITGNFSGGLRGFVSIYDDSATNDFEGVYFNDITHTGDYLVKFNFDGNAGSWTFERLDDIPDLGLDANGNPIPNPTYNTYVDYTASGGYIGVMSVDLTVGTYDFMADRIHFSTKDTGVQEYAVNNINLSDSTPVFSGGSANSWEFDGFNTSTKNYIYWEQLSMNLRFENCPPSDPEDIYEKKFININQQIDKTINRYEKYKISFTHGIDAGSTAKLSIYYYNTEGFGFKIEDIDSSFAGNTGYIDYDTTSATYLDLQYPNVTPYEQIVTIGDSEWSSVNAGYPTYNPDLKNSFVIQVKGDPNDTNAAISGYIDNIVMVQVYDGTNTKDTTVSFNEGVNGWTSFKSFVPDNGLSVSKKYFTFESGMAFQHYVPLKVGSTGYVDATTNNFVRYTPEEADNYNVFYDSNLQMDGAFSSITAVLNQEPSVVKMFNTINYEGSQTYVMKPTEISNSDGTIYTAAEQVDQNNVKAYVAGTNIDGWRCSRIQTDLDHGSVKEFIEKEGKWFNYIKGLNMDLTTVDTSLFSTQGVGIISSVNDITDPTADDLDAPVNVDTGFEYGGLGGGAGPGGGGGGGGY